MAGARTCHLVTVLGEAGVGKSRLIEEFVSKLGERAHVLRGQCQTHGEGITYWPIIQILEQAAGIPRRESPDLAMERLVELAEGDQDVTVGVARLLGLSGGTGELEDVYRGVRSALRRAASERSLVVIIDDVHSARQALLDLIERVTESLSETPVMLICLARPEFLDSRGRRGLNAVNAQSMALRPLDEAETGQLTRHLLEGGTPDPLVLAHVWQVTSGYPLFVEELIAMLMDRGELRLVDGRWVAASNLSDSELGRTPKIDAVIDARLDHLEDDEKEAIERASVVGDRFAAAEVAALVEGGQDRVVRETLLELVREDMLRLTESQEPDGGEMFRFSHGLIKERAYQRIPIKDRARLHERYARMRTEQMRDTGPHADQIQGFHLDQAYRCWVALHGEDHEEARRVGFLAGQRFAAAGHKHLLCGKLPEAEGALRRAVDLLPVGTPERMASLLDYAEALRDGRFEHAAEVHELALAEARRLRDEVAEQYALKGHPA